MSDSQKAPARALGAIKAGTWDSYLKALNRAVTKRLGLLDPTSQPPCADLPDHQFWVWVEGPGSPHWEVQGTKIPLSTGTAPSASLQDERDALRDLIHEMLDFIEDEPVHGDPEFAQAGQTAQA